MKNVIKTLALLAILATMLSVVGQSEAISRSTPSKYQNFKDLLNKKAGTEVDPEHFTTHWYLLGNTWTQADAVWKESCDDFNHGIATRRN